MMNIRKIPKLTCAQAYKIGWFLSQELSAEIGNNLKVCCIDNSEKRDVFIKNKSNLLARSIKTAHKKAEMFQWRLFTVF